MRPIKPQEPPRRVEVWWVEPNTPITHLWCSGGAETACVFGVLYDMRADHGSTRRAAEDGMERVDFVRPLDRLAVQEANMRGLMRIIRANKVHGRYRKAGTDDEYKF